MPSAASTIYIVVEMDQIYIYICYLPNSKEDTSLLNKLKILNLKIERMEINMSSLDKERDSLFR